MLESYCNILLTNRIKMDELDRDLVIHFASELLFVNNFNDKLRLKWYNRSAALLANRLYLMLCTPDVIEKEMKGCIMWNNLATMFHLSDRTYTNVAVYDLISTVHFVPSIHMDYLFMSIEMKLNDSTIKHLAKISDSLRYKNGILTAEADFPGAIIAKFAIIKRVNENKISIEDARDTYRAWLKICYDEWREIIHGEDISKANLTKVLEKYLF